VKVRAWFYAEADIPTIVDAGELTVAELAALIDSVVPEVIDAEVEGTE